MVSSFHVACLFDKFLFLPDLFLFLTAGADAALERSLADMWMALRGMDAVDLARFHSFPLCSPQRVPSSPRADDSSMLAYVKAWPLYGATVFPVALSGPVPQPFLLAVHETGMIYVVIIPFN